MPLCRIAEAIGSTLQLCIDSLGFAHLTAAFILEAQFIERFESCRRGQALGKLIHGLIKLALISVSIANVIK